MDTKLIYCVGCVREVPVAEFRRNERGELHVPYIHDVDPPHWATSGDALEAIIPGLADLVPDVDLPPTGESARLTKNHSAHSVEADKDKT